jgi:exopolysaccharide biosynthesis polyprenyl glycosylphosphotransferase
VTRIDSRTTVDDLPNDAGSRSRHSDWRVGYARGLLVTDVIVLVWAVLGSLVTVPGLLGATLAVPNGIDLRIGYPWVCGFLFVLWLVTLALNGSRDYRKLGTGTAEYKAVLTSGVTVVIVIALITFLGQLSFSRAYILTAVPAGIVGLVLSRFLWRVWLRTRRREGELSSRVIIVGGLASASQIAFDLIRAPEAGYRVLGACLSTGDHEPFLRGTTIPVLGGVRDLLDAVESADADTVLVVGGHNLSPAQMRQLSWSLEPGRQHLVVAPSITDIAGPRIRTRPVNGLPLIHVETPRYEGADRVVKRAFDILVSGGLLLLFSVPLIAVAAVVALTSPGGVFFSHERIGKNGDPFRMLKFRSMSADADSKLAELLAKQGSSDQPLFKIENDPRITPIGRFIRRYSIDEIPQLINVLRGDMSLVGPRPQVAKEVALYDHAAARRLYVKPGMTGLWQVSGRSNLGWEESVRLDLYYVENWSLTSDLVIMLRTVRAVLASDGAV